MLQRQILAAAKQQFCGPSLPSIFHIQRRAKNVNFFQRRTDQVLWNTVTSITKYGARKGQARRRPQYRRTEQFYRVGTIKSSPMRVIYPGLTTQVDEKIIKGTKEEFRIHTEPMFIETQDPEEKEEKMKIVKTMIAERPPKRRRKIKEDPKLTPQERGFTGGQWLGQRLGCPPTNKEGVEFGDFECICFEVRRLAIMHSSYGKIMYMRVLVFIGNGNGVGGWAVARCPMFRTNEAIASGIKQATRNLFFVERFEDRTIYQDFFAECNNTRVYAQRQEPNFGVMAHPRIKKMCELLGIRDIYVRTEGTTNNYIALCQAFITGLINQETHQQCADRTRLQVVELSPNNLFYPRVVASPLNEPVKSDEEVELKERMRLEDYYGEGRFPLNWGPKLPWWRNEVGHLHKQWTIYPYRNMEQRMIRLMADGTIKRWTHRERKKWSDEENRKVESGEKPLPMGIGLSDYVPWEDDKNQPAPFLGDPSKFMEPNYSLMDGEQEAIGEEELEELAMAQEQQRPRN